MKPAIMYALILVVVMLLSPGQCEDEPASADIEIVGLFANCGGQSVCDPKSHLTCVKSKCHCDYAKSYTLDHDTGLKCVLTADSDELFEYQESAEEDSSSYDHEDDHEDDDHDDDAGEDESSENNNKVGASSNNETQWPEDESEWQLPENNTGKGMKLDQNDGDKEDDTSAEEDIPPPVSTSNNNNASANESSSISSSNDIPQEPQAPAAPEKVVAQEEPQQQQSAENKEAADANGPNHDDHYDDWWESDEDEESSWNVPHDDDDDDVKVSARTASIHCTKDADCSQSSFGKFSICNLGGNTCECSDTEDKYRTTVLVNGACYIWKELDSPCISHEECDAVISGPAWCHTDKSSSTSFCTCRPFHIWDEERKECLPLATSGVGSPCLNDAQCFAEEALGPFSKCSEISSTCECMPGLGPKAKRVFPFQDKCMEERELGDDCVMDQECQASLGASARCHPLTRKCSCRPGHFCNKMLVRPAMSGFTLLVLIAICLSVGLGSVLCFVFKRREGRGEAYSFIKQQNDV